MKFGKKKKKKTPFVVDIKYPYLFQHEITNKCNYRCKFCYQANKFPQGKVLKREEIVYGETPLHQQPELSLEEIREHVIPQVAEMRFEHYCYVGAEPLLRFDDIVQLGEDIRKIKTVKEVALSTNGYLLEEHHIDEFKRAYRGKFLLMSIPFDSLDPQTMQALRPPKKDIFERTMNAIDLALKKKMIISTPCVANRLNFHEIEDILKFLKKKGRGRIFVELYPMYNYGKGAENEDLCLTDEQMQEFDKIKLKYFGQPVLMWDSMPCPFTQKAWDKIGNKAFQASISMGCSCGNNTFRIDHAGNIHPCNFFDFPLGHVMDSPHAIKEIWEGHPDVIKWRNREIGGKCGNCKHLVVCGGCRSRALMETGDVFGGVESCPGGPDGHPLEEIMTKKLKKTYKKYIFEKWAYYILSKLHLM